MLFFAVFFTEEFLIVRWSCLFKISLTYFRTFCITCKLLLNYFLLRAYMNEWMKHCWLWWRALFTSLFCIWSCGFTWFLCTWILLADRLSSTTIHSHWRLLIKLIRIYGLLLQMFPECWLRGLLDWTMLWAGVDQCCRISCPKCSCFHFCETLYMNQE